MSYVDGYVLPIKKSKIPFYKKMAQDARKMWMNAGALDYKECIGDDLLTPFGMSFSKLMMTAAGETVIFAFITFKSRAHRDRVNKKVWKSMDGMEIPDMPFDVKKMAYGGFKTLVGK